MKRSCPFLSGIGFLALFSAQVLAAPGADPKGPPIEQPSAPAITNANSDGVGPAATVDNSETNALAPGMLKMNFRGASLEQVLNYMSEAAGFIINVKPGTSVRGRVDLWSSQPLTRDEALNLLDTVLVQNGLAAIRNGRTLTIVNRDEAKTQNIPVMQGSDPNTIPNSDMIVTQIIPVRFVEAGQLLKDLQPLVSVNQTTMTANEAGNAIVITDTQSNIKKVAQIIRAIDLGAEDFTEVKVFRLTNADPSETADMLSNLFPDESKSGSGSQSPVSFRDSFRSRFFGGSPGGGSSGNSDSSSRIKKRNRVIALADQRTASVIVSAPRDLIEQIGDVIKELDDNPKGKTTVKVYRFQNADPREALPVLEDIFQKNTSTQNRNNNSANQNSPLMTRGQTTTQTQSSGTRSTTQGGTRNGGITTFGQ